MSHGSESQPFTMTLTLTLLLLRPWCVVSGETMLDPDSGKVIWGSLPQPTAYKTKDYAATKGALKAFYGLAGDFADLMLPRIPPVGKK